MTGVRGPVFNVGDAAAEKRLYNPDAQRSDQLCMERGDKNKNSYFLGSGVFSTGFGLLVVTVWN